MPHEYKIVDPSSTKTTQQKLNELYAQIEALENYHVQLSAIESPSEIETEDIEATETELASLIAEYEALGGVFS
ncbi:MAG: hypothetical protein VW235_01400 [Rhodospirillaceae bacterium]|jgi:Holliday junction resolvasome RuvABC endonuclease subunit